MGYEVDIYREVIGIYSVQEIEEKSVPERIIVFLKCDSSGFRCWLRTQPPTLVFYNASADSRVFEAVELNANKV